MVMPNCVALRNEFRFADDGAGHPRALLAAKHQRVQLRRADSHQGQFRRHEEAVDATSPSTMAGS